MTVKNYNVLHVHDIQTHADALAAQHTAGARRRIELKEKNALKQTTLFKLHVQNSKTETKTIQNVVWID